MATKKPGDKPTKKKGYQHVDATGSQQYTHADFTYVRGKRKRSLPEEEEAGELNIVPYLDIMVNLIMFLLVSQATMISLGIVNVTAPTYSSPGGGASKPDPLADLKLTVGVAMEGFYIAAKGGVLESGEEPKELTPDGVGKRAPTIPKKPDGTYDYMALSHKLRSIKTVFPKATAVFLAADQTIPYQVIVKTLDAAREDKTGELFPAVAFSRLN